MRRGLSPRSKTYVATGSLLAALLLVLWLIYASFTNLLEANERNTHSYQVIVKTERLFAALLKVQTSARGYLLTGSRQFLDAVEAGLRAYRRHLHETRVLVADNPDQLQRLDALQARQQAWAAEIARLLELRRAAADGEGELGAVLMALDFDRARTLFDAMQATINDIIGIELALLAERAGAVRKLGALTTSVLFFGGLFAVLLAGVLSLLLARNMGRLRLANQELEKRERHVHAVLDHAAEGIITVDERGIVHSANPALRALFGYAPGEVVGRSVRMLAAAEEQDEGPLGALASAGEVEVKRKNGEVFPVDMTLSEMPSDGGRLFILIMQDISQRRLAEHLKAQFVSTVSHELRTPLTSIRGALGLLAGGMAGPVSDQSQKLVDIAHKNSERLVRLINDLLDIEKMDAGRLTFHMRPLELLPLVAHSLEVNQPYADGYGVRLEFDDAAEDARVLGDADRLEQVLANLLSNAVKYSPTGDAVRVAVTPAGGAVRVSVRDRGAGVPEAFQPALFQRFSQADSSDTRQKGGTGLGLAICKTIVERHGGTVGYSPASPGSTFYFELPLAQGSDFEQSGVQR